MTRNEAVEVLVDVAKRHADRRARDRQMHRRDDVTWFSNAIAFSSTAVNNCLHLGLTLEELDASILRAIASYGNVIRAVPFHGVWASIVTDTQFILSHSQ